MSGYFLSLSLSLIMSGIMIAKIINIILNNSKSVMLSFPGDTPNKQNQRHHPLGLATTINLSTNTIIKRK